MSDGPGPGASTTAHHQQHPHSHHHRRPKKVARFLLRSLTRCCYTVAWLLGVVAVLVGVLLALDLYATHFSEQAVQTDEHVEFFITHSSCNLEDTLSNECFVTAHGVVFEPELDSSVRRQVASTILHLVGLQQLDDAARRNYDRRVWLFMRDFERGKNVSVALTPCSEPHHRVAEGTNVDDHSFLHRALHWTLHSRDVAVHEEGDEAGKPRTCDEHCLLLRELHKQVVVGTMLTAANGHFKLSIPVPKSLVKHYLRDSPSPVLWVCFRTVLPEADRRVFTGRAQLSIVGSGRPLHVISDIDDTIKVTHVRFLRRMAAHTFLHEYEAVQGMARLFRRLAVAHHAVFHYVSGSPWQLHEDLVAMMTRAGFPLGSMHLKLVRFDMLLGLFSRGGEGVGALTASPFAYKMNILTDLIEGRLSHARLLLVGDAGEKDPEAYGALARLFPEAVVCILIRQVPDVPLNQQVLDAAFEHVPRNKWHIFEDADRLGEQLDVSQLGNPELNECPWLPSSTSSPGQTMEAATSHTAASGAAKVDEL